jgi:ribosomal protein L11 methyltransferase
MKTNEAYLRLDFSCPAPFHDYAIANLMDFGFEGFDQHDQGFHAYIPENLVGEHTRTEMADAVSNSDYMCEIVGEERIMPRNWNEEWEKSIKSQFIDPFFICPTWVDDPQPEGSIRVVIDPKMAFGTGNHETTRLIMSLLPKLVKPGATVLDVGTGTGILAIAALKLGASKAFGFDIDEWSFNNASENSAQNGTESTFEVAIGSFETVQVGETYDLVIANVNRGILIEMSSSIVKAATNNGGIVVLSGLLYQEEAHILADDHFASLSHVGTVRENDWIAMVFHKK